MAGGKRWRETFFGCLPLWKVVLSLLLPLLLRRVPVEVNIAADGFVKSLSGLVRWLFVVCHEDTKSVSFGTKDSHDC